MQESEAIVYASRKLELHKKNYLIHDLELTVIVFALKDYDLVTNFCPGKENVVVDALNRKSLVTLLAMNT